MKVKCITNYQDLELGKLVKVGQEIEVTDARATILIKAHVAETVPTPTKVATDTAPKKKTPAKKVDK